MPGISIEDNALIGAGSVVTKNIPRNAIVTGNPAKIINYRNNESKKETLPLKTHTSHAPCIVNIPSFQDIRGSLSVVEVMKHCPFPIERVFWTYDVPSKEKRGEHSHKSCSQFLICIKGSVSVVTFEGKLKKNFKLNHCNLGLLIPPKIWSFQYEFTKDAVLLVLASEIYDEDDYIRSYEEYLKST